MFEALLDLLRQPAGHGVVTDDSVLLIYPPERELDFREELLERFQPRLSAAEVPYRMVDVTGLVFEGLDDETIAQLCAEEFEDYRWMVRSLAQRTDDEGAGATGLEPATSGVTGRGPRSIWLR